MSRNKILPLVAMVIIWRMPVTYAVSEFLSYAQDLAKAGIIVEKGEEVEYRLGDSVTRAEMVKIAVGLMGEKSSNCKGTFYTDVDTHLGNLCGYIETASQVGIVSKSNITFRPTDPVTRAEMIKMLLIANKIPSSDISAGFRDVTDSLGDLSGYINAGVEQGCIASGMLFRPNEAASRWESFKVASCISITTTDHDANFSPETLAFLRTNTGLDGEQWDNIMKLVNKSEQDSLDWTASYGYCEDIGDDRGYTIGIFWATTGGPNDMWPDGPQLFREFDAANGSNTPSTEGGLARIGVNGSMNGRVLNIADSPSEFCAKVSALQDNPIWREAIWRTFYDVYIQYSVEEARNRGFFDALVIGSFVDTALNQGGPSLGAILSKSGNSPDVYIFMKNFYEERSKVVNTNQYNQAPNGTRRVKQWSDLLDRWQLSLKNADADIIAVTSWIME